MNLLAHALLAYISLDDTGGQECTGALMADFFTGQDMQRYPPGIRTGIRQHRDIDGFTDAHPNFIACRRALAAEGVPRHSAGILLDIFWDHVLASEWDRWGEPLCGLELEPFCSRIYQRLELNKDVHSPSFRRAYTWLVASSWLSSYASVDGIGQTLKGMSTRMSGNIDLSESLGILTSGYAWIQTGFSEFWPEMVEFAHSWHRDEVS
ncbi:MAG: ACP phosphodiesterase [Spirochaetia bacterium]|jgi:acyl carrier protein phosphodiesterase|nr:ACP phosphodiesterase [Spirochaetia bacterium]